MDQTVGKDSKPRIEWLAVLQGFSMLLVVLGHVTLTGTFRDPSMPVEAAIERVIYSFHMPLFIFISGWLFHYTCIGRGIRYRDMMSKKLVRLGIPFLAFTLFTILLKLLLPSLMNRPVDLQELIDTFILFRSNPLGEMWFITVLLILMSFYPVYRWLDRHDALIWGLGATLVIFFVFPDDVEVFQLNKVGRMITYFVAGILCCRYSVIEKYAAKWWVATILFAIFLICNVLEMPDGLLPDRLADLIKTYAGIGLSVSICCMLAQIRPQSFSSFREHTFQIFLMGIFFQMAVRVAYSRFGSDSTLVAIAFYALSVLLGIYIPVLISRIVKSRFPYLRKLFGL